MKKGFTLIELLAVIALLGVIITIASISITSLKKNSEERLLNEKIKYIETCAIRWGEDNLNSISTGGVIKTVQYLIDNSYIIGDNDNKDELLIPGTNDTFNSKYICVKYENIFSGKDLSDIVDNNGSSYKGNTNYQVTAKYKGTVNSCN